MIKKTLAAATILLVVMSTFMMFNLTTFAAPTVPKPVDLKIYVSPSSILADNSSYRCIFVQLLDANGNPARAEQETTIDLSSSAPGIGIVDQTTTIPKNATYASANFTSTYLPGTTVITATAPNYATVNAAITTIGPYTITTKPADLKIYISPSSILADNSTYNCIFVQLIDANGVPTRAEQNTTIDLSSSTAGIGTVDQTTIIPKNATYASANFTSTYLPGTTTITATAPNFATVNAAITTIGPYPYKTTVYGFPFVLPADGGIYGAVMVQLQDISGSPARAPNDVNVSLFSSNPAVGSVNSSITILQGQTYAIAHFTSTTTQGATTITALGHGYASTQLTFNTTTLTSSQATHLKIFEGPPQVLADNNVYRQFAVELQNSTGYPTTRSSDTIVTIASADNTIATTDNEIIIPAGSTYALSNLYTTYRPGTVTITAATNGLDIDSQTLTTVGYTPSKLVVFCAPSNLAADNSTYQVVQVQLQDDSGRPARNPDSGTILKLFSSDLTVGNVCSPIMIPLGQTQATGNFTLTNTPGATTITAMGSNYTTGQATLTTYGFTPTKLAVYCTPSILPSDNSTYQIIQIQLQNDQGNPAINPYSNTTVRLFSSNTTVGNVASEITIPLGETQATGNFTLTNTHGTTMITAIASNYTTGQADITTCFIDYRPMQATVTVNPDHANGGNSVQVSAYITGDGNPVTGAQVLFTSDIGGAFSAVQAGNGYYKVTFITPNLSQTAVCTITLHASKTEWLDCTGTAQITVAPAVIPTPTPTATPASTPTSSPTATSSPTPTPSAGPNSADTTTPQPTIATNGVAPIQLLIKDSNSIPLSDINVTSTAQPAGVQALSAVTNATGFVTFQNVTVGSYTFQIFKEGYQLVSRTFNATDQTLTHTIFLSNADSAGNSQDTTTSPLLIPAIAAVITIVAIVACILFVRRRWDIKLSPSS